MSSYKNCLSHHSKSVDTGLVARTKIAEVFLCKQAGLVECMNISIDDKKGSGCFNYTGLSSWEWYVSDIEGVRKED